MCGHLYQVCEGDSNKRMRMYSLAFAWGQFGPALIANVANWKDLQLHWVWDTRLEIAGSRMTSWNIAEKWSEKNLFGWKTCLFFSMCSQFPFKGVVRSLTVFMLSIFRAFQVYFSIWKVVGPWGPTAANKGVNVHSVPAPFRRKNPGSFGNTGNDISQRLSSMFKLVRCFPLRWLIIPRCKLFKYVPRGKCAT